MDLMYENSGVILSTVASNENCSQFKDVNVSMQLSAQETTSTIMTAELTDNYTRVREQLSFYKDWVGTLYFFSSHKLNWLSSRAFCVSKGADLVIITSQSEQMFLISKIKESHWIGLNDLDTEGHWVWVNNQTLNETGVQFWFKRDTQKSEPDNWRVVDPTGENCAVVKNEAIGSNDWFDISCNYQKKFICAKKF
ncbi:C-type lectin domain family 4 member F-like isoform X2 [Megalobrama amblycephala]|uniref:C-type lectin domain family 4 member F-like isoform X2 n=1 Tax=Megalobrama amblycephala TaxID=75352 RepID=UPI00201460DD|nr:C-type lectin domain family 4 member F-like isoform X2 [Megalobrama amblycephala]